MKIVNSSDNKEKMVGFFFITASTLLVVIGLFLFSASSSFSFGRLHVSRNLSILPKCPISWPIVVYNNFLQSFVFL